MLFTSVAFTSAASEAVSAGAMGGAGIGATSAAGSGLAEGISSAVPLFTVFGMAVGAVVGAASAGEHNRALRSYVRNAYAQINSQKQETSLSYYDQTNRAAQESSQMDAQAQLQLSSFGSGLSNNEYIAQIQADQAYDQMIRKHEYDLSEKGLDINKENVYSQGKASYANPFVSALQGAMSYGAAAGQIGSTVDTLNINTANNAALKQFVADYEDNPSAQINIARGQALAAGVPAYKLSAGGAGNIYLQPFMSGLKEQGLQTTVLSRQANLASAQLQGQQISNSIALQNARKMPQGSGLGPLFDMLNNNYNYQNYWRGY